MESYKSLPKFHWRNWVYNRMIERLHHTTHKNRATCLYLLGPDDLDRHVGINKGLSPYNMIGVDLEQSYVVTCRKNDGLAIHGDFIDTIALWPENWPLDFIVADFKSGLTDKVLTDFLVACTFSRGVSLHKTQICVNLQRGRDASSNDLRDQVKNTILTQIPDPTEQELTDDIKHRGKLFFYAVLQLVKAMALSATTIDKLCNIWPAILKRSAPIFNSYRQTNKMPWMDTVIFNMPILMPQEFKSDSPWLDAEHELFSRSRTEFKALQQQITAVKAIRTMKRNKK